MFHLENPGGSFLLRKCVKNTWGKVRLWVKIQVLMSCIFTSNVTHPLLFFIHFAIKNQPPGFFESGTLAWNEFRNKIILTCYKNTICFCIPICYILFWVDITWLKFTNFYLGSAGVVDTAFAFYHYCPSLNPLGIKFKLFQFHPTTVMLMNSNGCLNAAQVANGLCSAESLHSAEPMVVAPSGNTILWKLS